MTVVSTFNPAPSIARAGETSVTVARSFRAGAGAVGVPVGPKGAVPRQLGVDRTTLARHGFEGKPGQTFVAPSADGPAAIAVGVGDGLDAAGLRDAAAAFARAAGKEAVLATSLADVKDLDPAVAAQAVVEGVLLARYRYGALKKESPVQPVTSLTLVVGGRARRRRRPGPPRPGVGRCPGPRP